MAAKDNSATAEKSKSNEPKLAAVAVDDTVDEIIYHPNDGDPVRVKWNGLEFKAYVPTKVSRKHCVLALVKQEQTMPDGSTVTRATEKRIPMVDLARRNPSFSVNGETPFARKEGKSRVPTTSDEYRGYAIGWIAASSAASAMDARWDAEATLREKCGVDDGDVAYLRPFFEARHEEVKAAA